MDETRRDEMLAGKLAVEGCKTALVEGSPKLTKGYSQCYQACHTSINDQNAHMPPPPRMLSVSDSKRINNE